MSPSRHVDAFTNAEALQAPSFRVFMEVPLHRHDRLTKSLAAGYNLNSQLLSSPQRWEREWVCVVGVGRGCESPLITWLVPLATSLQPEVI